MPKITPHPRLRTAVRKAKSGKATTYYFYDRRSEGLKDVPLGKDWTAALAKWEALSRGRPLPADPAPVVTSCEPNFDAISLNGDLAADDGDDSIESLLMLPTVKVLPVGESPDDDGCGIYALFGADRGLNYIGKSINVGARIIQHMQASYRGERSRFVEYGYVPVPEWMLGEVEIAHIWALKPPENALYEMPCWEYHAEAVKMLRDAWGARDE